MEATGPVVRAGTRILRRTLLGVTGLLAAALVWGAVIEPRFLLAVEDSPFTSVTFRVIT